MGDKIRIPYEVLKAAAETARDCGTAIQIHPQVFAEAVASWMREKIAKEFERRASGLWSSSDIAERIRKVGSVE